jgi:hypothetical protein
VSPLADQRTGAGILWIAGELFGVLAVAVVVRQWMRAEERKAARIDRRLDAERMARAAAMASPSVDARDRRLGRPVPQEAEPARPTKRTGARAREGDQMRDGAG